MKLPDSICRFTDGRPYTENQTGMSGSRVLVFDDFVLKAEPFRQTVADTVEVMHWMENRLPVPKILCSEVSDGWSYLLMSRAKGEMSCSDYYMEHSEELVTALADGLKMLWETDLSGCPRDRGITAELAEARYRIDHDMVDMENTEPETFGEGSFRNPQDLLQWLEDHQPDYDPVLSHGDYCLPNIFLENGKVSCFIDLGDTGIGDRWRDIALCWRSLKHNFNGSYGGKAYPEFNPDILFEKLGIEPNPEKLQYYMLLDELF